MLVYLDSQDYSKATDPHFIGNEAFAALSILIKNSAAEGTHQFPFSNLHIQEATHTENSARSLALRRARFMEEIAAGKAFIPFEYLIMKEAAAILADCDFSVDISKLNLSIVRIDGAWWPAELLENEGPLDLKATLDAALPDLLRRAPNRKERRKLAKFKDHQPNHALFANEENILNLVNWFDENFPPCPEMKDGVMARQYLLGKLDLSVLVNIAMRNALRPARFIEWTIDKLDEGKVVASYIKTSGYEATSKIAEIILAVEENMQPTRIQKFDDELKKAAFNGLDLLAKSVRRGLLAGGLDLLIGCGALKSNHEKDEALELLVAYNGESAPGLDLITKCARVWLGKVAAPMTTKQKIRRSDILDLFHTIYLPYVDLFRADGSFSEVIRQTKSPFSLRVIDSTDALSFALK